MPTQITTILYKRGWGLASPSIRQGKTPPTEVSHPPHCHIRKGTPQPRPHRICTRTHPRPHRTSHTPRVIASHSSWPSPRFHREYFCVCLASLFRTLWCHRGESKCTRHPHASSLPQVHFNKRTPRHRAGEGQGLRVNHIRPHSSAQKCGRIKENDRLVSVDYSDVKWFSPGIIPPPIAPIAPQKLQGSGFDSRWLGREKTLATPWQFAASRRRAPPTSQR